LGKERYQHARSVTIKITYIETKSIEINPISASTGLGTKRKGIIIRSGSELEQINQLLANPKVVELAKKIEVVNPKTKDDSSKSTDNTRCF
jgi:hypothetical protein